MRYKTLSENVDIDCLRQVRPDFCSTLQSRVHLRGRTTAFNLEIPVFDRANFERDLPKVPQNVSDEKTLMETIQLFNDTYLYPACLISLVIFNKKDKVERLYNAETFAGLTRDIKDWSLKDKNSIANYAIRNCGNSSFLLFGDISGMATTFFQKIDSDYADRLLIEDEKAREESLLETYIEYTEVPKISNFDLLRKEAGTGISYKRIDYPVRSAVLSPLRFNDSLTGMILIAMDSIHLYSSLGEYALGEINILDLQRFLDQITLAINGKLKNYN